MLRAMASRGVRAILTLLFGAGLIQHAILRFELSTRLLGFSLSPVTTALTLTALACAVLALVLPLRWRAPDRWSRLAGWLGSIALLLIVPFSFIAENFGYVDFETVLISIADNNTADIADVAFKDFSGPLIEATLTTLLLAGSAWYLLRRMPGFVPVLLAISIFAIGASHPVGYLWRQVFPDPALAMVGAADLVAPQVTAVPPQKPNLVIIYLESLERSYRDIPASADAFSAFAAWEDRGFAAVNVGQVKGTHFSAAGLVASQCGIPLLPRGLTDPKLIQSAEDVAAHDIAEFLPGVDCLGDVLSAQGYEGAYVNGSNAEIFAIADFLKGHGVATVRGLKNEPDYANLPGSNTWGVPDTALFQVAGEEMDRLSAGDKPFFLMVFTASTHGPGGYLDPGCSYDPPIKPRNADSQMPAAIHCTGALVQGFLDNLQRRGLAENTVVALMSDHLAMPNTMVKELKGIGDARRNYFVILNSPRGTDGTKTDRAATMIDIFPTLIESLGFTLKDGAGNLGRSLMSDTPTLAEKLGFDIVDRALFGNQEIRRSVWTPR